ncbi:MAG TPA: hypothetical protein DCS93_12260 [Microscillaceae bacterium]|nr:hypothetical protein [Microscillaceae bacterium]
MNNKLLSALVLLLATSFAVAQGIQFENDTWAKVKAKAKAENKHIFVDIYTTWCRPCVWQSKKIFPQKKVGDFFNQHFVSFKLDGEKEEGINLVKKYRVAGYPTLLYFNPNGELVHKTTNASSAKVLLSDAKRALNPKSQIYALQDRFEKGERGEVFLKQYLEDLYNAYEDTSEPADAYLALLGKEKWTTAKGWAIIRKYVRTSSSPAFKYLLANKAKFDKVTKRKKAVTKYIKRVFTWDMQEAIQAKDKQQLASFRKEFKQALSKEADKHIARVANKRNSFAWKYYKKYDDAKSLKRALVWAEESVDFLRASFNTNTQAHLLFKLKHYQEAKQVAEASIELAKKAKQNPKETEALLAKINAKL